MTDTVMQSTQSKVPDLLETENKLHIIIRIWGSYTVTYWYYNRFLFMIEIKQSPEICAWPATATQVLIRKDVLTSVLKIKQLYAPWSPETSEVIGYHKERKQHKEMYVVIN